MLQRRMAGWLAMGAALMLTCAGCKSKKHEGQAASTVKTKRHIVDYATSDPNLEPTLFLGGYLEVRTADGGPVVIDSQKERQKQTAEQLRQERAKAAEDVPAAK